MKAKTILDRVEELARLQSVFAHKCQVANAARPQIDATPHERQAYQFLYQASEEAKRTVQSAAIKFAVDARGLLDAAE